MGVNFANRRIMNRKQSGGRLRWSIDNGLSARDGFLRDCSITGMALVVDRQDAPFPGDRIRIVGDEVKRKQYVVRVKPIDRDRVLVACRTDGR